MSSLTPKQEARVEGICRNCVQLLRLHAREAATINPAIEPATESLLFRKMATVRRALSNKMSFGGQSYLMADILMSDDEDKKRVLLDPKDERSLFFQIVADDDMDQAPDKKSHIYDLHSYFVRLDPRLGPYSELVIHWVWWDLPDAVDMYLFDQAVQRFEALRSSQLSDQVIQAYRRTLNRTPSQDVTRQDILQHEADTCRKVLERWEKRRDEEQGYQIILAFDPPTGEDEDQQEVDRIILELGSRLTGIKRVQESPELHPNAQVYYAEKMGLSSKDVTVEAVLEYENSQVRSLKSDLSTRLELRRGMTSVPYNYRTRLMEQMRERHARLVGSIPQ